LKFNDIQAQDWPDLKPYLDTCLLPLTGLTGFEEPAQVTLALEQLRDALETIEIPYKGRVVTYPALHYITGVDIRDQLNTISLHLKRMGFRFVIVLTLHTEAALWNVEQTDLLIAVDMQQWTSQSEQIKSSISKQVQHLWQHND
jgi:23S rRNA (pseudouridine1915-N3)-methyltransferase